VNPYLKTYGIPCLHCSGTGNTGPAVDHGYCGACAGCGRTLLLSRTPVGEMLEHPVLPGEVETVFQAAMRIDGEIWSIRRPGRHDTIMRQRLFHLGLHSLNVQGRSQGFVTSHGRYVTRGVAAKLAKAAKQPLRDPGYPIGKILYSEDLW
jgi:hypothetical protein